MISHEGTVTDLTDVTLKQKCRYCQAQLPEPFLELGSMALANSFLSRDEPAQDEFTCPLSVTYCPGCHLVQLTHAVSPQRMFSQYLYVSSTSKTFQQHFALYAREVKALFPGRESLLAVDIGSNDGLLLECFAREGMQAVGVEPALNLSRTANERGLRTINRFFDDQSRREIARSWGRADAVTANNVFAHVDDIASFCRNARLLLNDDGVFVIEFPYLVTMCEEMLFDMIYHEHLSYISLTALSRFLRRCRLEIFDVRPVASHGGSLRVFIQLEGAGRASTGAAERMMRDEESGGYLRIDRYRAFADSVRAVKDKLLAFVHGERDRGNRIAGYGAPAKANTLINFCGISRNEIAYIVDDNPLKQGTLSPGARIPVVDREQLRQRPADAIVIFAWNFADEIVRKLEEAVGPETRFFVPLPEPRLIPDPSG